MLRLIGLAAVIAFAYWAGAHGVDWSDLVSWAQNVLNDIASQVDTHIK